MIIIIIVIRANFIITVITTTTNTVVAGNVRVSHIKTDLVSREFITDRSLPLLRHLLAGVSAIKKEGE